MARTSRGPARSTKSVAFSGPFFTKDPVKTFRQNVRSLMDAVATEGESAVRSEIESHAGQMRRYTGHTARSVRGRTSSLSGKRWQVSAVVSTDTGGMDRTEAIRTKAAGASIERRWHPFRRVASALRRSKAAISADLTKGMG